jgi:putative ABC transport system permease protein
MKLWKKITTLFGKEKLDAEMSEEMREHLERRTRANVDGGMSAEEARYAAQRQFGGMDQLKEVAREERGWRWLQDFSRDGSHALRSLAKSRGFTTIALLTLALGIGVNTSMFSLLNALLFQPAPYPEPDALFRVYRTSPTAQTSPHSPANFLDLQARAKSFSHLAAFNRTANSYVEDGRPAEQMSVLQVTGDFFAVLGVQPALGRFLSPEEDQTGREKVVVLTDAFWRQRLAADPEVVGRSLRLDGEGVTVIGVMPPGFDDRRMWGRISGWRPLALSAETRKNRGGNWLQVLGRLAPGTSADAAGAELTVISADLAREYPESNAKNGLALVPFGRSTQDPQTRSLSWFAMGLAGCVLLIACVNLANLLFARNAVRAREHAIRAALGASRGRLIRQSLTESLVLALGGGALGLLVAIWGNAAIGARLFVGGAVFPLAVDWRTTGFALGVAVAAAAFFGVLPALLASRTDLNHALKQVRGGGGTSSHRVRHTLIVVEVALSLVLLASAGFLLRGLDRFLVRDHGWQPERLLTAYLKLPATRYPNPAANVAFYDRLRARLKELPGVENVSLSSTLPFYGFGFGQRFIVEGQTPPPLGSEPQRDVNYVGADYFDTLGIALLEGRTFAPTDRTGPEPTVIGESMARRLWPGESAIGKRIAHPAVKEWMVVIGVVRDISFASNLGAPNGRFQTYRYYDRETASDIALALRCTVPPASLADALRRAVAELDPELPVDAVRPAAQAVEQNLANYSLTGWLLSGFAVLGLLLASVGIYGVISGFVVYRTNEIGLRLALGARTADVLGLVFRQGMRLTIVGAVIGLTGAYWVARGLIAMMPSLPAAEIGMTTAATAALIGVAAVACLIPAWRAIRISPVSALRSE